MIEREKHIKGIDPIAEMSHTKQNFTYVCLHQLMANGEFL